MKHFTLDDRIRIQRGLTINLSFTEIGKDRTSVSREVQAHSCGEGKPSRSKCKHRQECIRHSSGRRLSLLPFPGSVSSGHYADLYTIRISKKL